MESSYVGTDVHWPEMSKEFITLVIISEKQLWGWLNFEICLYSIC